jgi:two-component system nitrate/nitrite response regulator NarL
MKAVIISSYALIRAGLHSIISSNNNINIEAMAESIESVVKIIKEGKIDMILLDLHEQNERELQLIRELKMAKTKSRFIILDFNSNKELFIKAIRCGVEGYILAKSNEVEILHIIEQVCRGKKYFDAYFIDNMINEEDDEAGDIDLLTPREKEILCEIGKGMSNRKISEKFFISEHTVKKHINHIFDKLNIRDRTRAALYANKCGMMNEYARSKAM